MLVVAAGGDWLALRVARGLREGGAEVSSVAPEQLAGARLTLDGDALYWDGQRLLGVLLRPPAFAGFSEEFEQDDRPFCDAEVRALWLAASHLPSVLAINRYGPGDWLPGPSWLRLREDLADAGVELAPLTFGGEEPGAAGHWLPYCAQSPRALPGASARRAMGTAAAELNGGAVRHLAVAGRLLQGARSSTARSAAAARAATFLDGEGIVLSEIGTDARGRVLWIDPEPRFSDQQLATDAASRLVERFHAHLYGG